MVSSSAGGESSKAGGESGRGRGGGTFTETEQNWDTTNRELSVFNRPGRRKSGLGRPRPFSRRPMKPIRPIGWPIGLRHVWGIPYPSDIRLTA